MELLTGAMDFCRDQFWLALEATSVCAWQLRRNCLQYLGNILCSSYVNDSAIITVAQQMIGLIPGWLAFIYS